MDRRRSAEANAAEEKGDSCVPTLAVASSGAAGGSRPHLHPDDDRVPSPHGRGRSARTLSLPAAEHLPFVLRRLVVSPGLGRDGSDDRCFGGDRLLPAPHRPLHPGQLVCREEPSCRGPEGTAHREGGDSVAENL